jgi:hypothetical protein
LFRARSCDSRALVFSLNHADDTHWENASGFRSAISRDDDDKESAVFGGASEYLVEPPTPAELLAAIKRQS